MTYIDTLRESGHAQRVEEHLAKVPDAWIEWAGGDREFALWLIYCDKRVTRAVGLGLRDMEDWLWRDAYDNNVTPANAVIDAFANWGAYDTFGGEGYIPE